VNLGLYVDSSLGIGPVAQAAEAAGLSHLWLYDSPLVFADTSMAALVAAQATKRIGIGPGVANPLQRPAEYTAQMLATLQLAAAGRVFFGIGVGNSARRSLGLPPARLAEVAAHVRVVRGMLDRGVAMQDDGDGVRPVRFIHPNGPWIDPVPVPLWVSAFGPVGQVMAGQVGDGVLIRWEGREAVARAVANVASGTRDPGLGPKVDVAVVYAVQPIAHDDELETAALRAALGPLVVSRLRYLTANAETADEVPAAFRDGFEAYRKYRSGLDPVNRHLDNYRGYLVFTPPDLERFVTPASMRAVALIGSPGRIAEELREMAAAGVDHCSMQMAGDQATWCARMAGQVFPLIGAGSGTSAQVEVTA